MSEWFECVCQFLRNQSSNLSGVMQQLGNQNTISDIDTQSSDSISDHLNGLNPQNLNTQGQLNQLISQVTPMQVFMVVLAIIWTYMFIFAQMKKETTKPVVNNSGSGPKNDEDKGEPGGVA